MTGLAILILHVLVKEHLVQVANLLDDVDILLFGDQLDQLLMLFILLLDQNHAVVLLLFHVLILHAFKLLLFLVRIINALATLQEVNLTAQPAANVAHLILGTQVLRLLHEVFKCGLAKICEDARHVRILLDGLAVLSTRLLACGTQFIAAILLTERIQSSFAVHLFSAVIYLDVLLYLLNDLHLIFCLLLKQLSIDVLMSQLDHLFFEFLLTFTLH